MSLPERMKAPLLSVVVPMYNEEDSIDLFFDRLLPVLEAISPDWEIVCVNDGSADATVKAIRGWHTKEPRIKLLSFSRNFGKEAALTAGLFHANGDAIIPIDADLQDPPELITEMVERWREGYKVVLATRRFRKGDSWMKKYSALGFYRIIGMLSSTDIPKNSGDFRLMDRQAVEAIRHLPERTRFMKGLLSWVGFPTTQVYYDRPERAAGDSKFNFFSLWGLALDGVFSFSTMPLKIWTYIGAGISTLSLVYALYIILSTLIAGSDVPGYASIMVAVLFMGGIQLLSLGIIGEYVGRIYRETKQRPLYIVEESLGIGETQPHV